MIEELLSQWNYCAIIRANCESRWNAESEIPIAADPGLRLVLQQEQEYAGLLAEARSRDTESSRLLEIYQMNIMQIEYRNGYPQSGGFDWYDWNSRKDFDVLHASKADREDSRFRHDALYPELDPKLEGMLQANPVLAEVVRFLTFDEHHFQFSYICAEVAANPNAQFQLPHENTFYVMTVFDQLNERVQPVLFKWLQLMLHELDAPYFASTIQWIDLVKSMRFESNLNNAIEKLDCHSLLDSTLHSEFDSHDPNEFKYLIEPQFLDDNEMGGLNAVIVRVSPYLGGIDSDFLRQEFDVESNCIKQAILLNPYCPEDIRERVRTAGSELYAPTRLEMARFAAYAGFYEQVENWLGTEFALDELLINCDQHIVEAVRGALRP